MFNSYVDKGMNIYGMVTQRKLGDYIISILKSRNIKCIYYHGENIRRESNM